MNPDLCNYMADEHKRHLETCERLMQRLILFMPKSVLDVVLPEVKRFFLLLEEEYRAAISTETIFVENQSNTGSITEF